MHKPGLQYYNFNLRAYKFAFGVRDHAQWSRMMCDLERLVSAAARAHRKRLSDELVTLALCMKTLGIYIRLYVRARTSTST